MWSMKLKDADKKGDKIASNRAQRALNHLEKDMITKTDRANGKPVKKTKRDGKSGLVL